MEASLYDHKHNDSRDREALLIACSFCDTLLGISIPQSIQHPGDLDYHKEDQACFLN